MSINFGEGGSALCVIYPSIELPDFNTKDYVTKIALKNNDINSIENYILYNEVSISNYIKKNIKNYDKYFSVVDKIVELDYDKFPDKFKSLCNLEKGNTYILLFSKNGSCKEIKKNELVVIKETGIFSNSINIGKITSIKYNDNYEVKLNKQKLIKSKDEIERYCGNLFNPYSIELCFNSEKKFKLNFKHLVVCLKKLHDINIIHTDIKPQNLLVNSKGNIKMIDFGGSLNLSTINICKLSQNSINYLYRSTKFKKELYYIIKTYTKEFIPPDVVIFLFFLKYDLDYKEINKNIIITELNNFGFRLDFNIYDNFFIDRLLTSKHSFIKNFFCNKTYVKKFDIYSLGITIKYIYDNINKKFKMKNDKLENLILNMINYDVYERYSIDEILNHSYFENTPHLSKKSKQKSKQKLKKKSKKSK